MARSDLIDFVCQTMARAGFAVSERCDLRPVSFDLVARRDDDLYILKVLHNVDALNEAIAHEIKLLSRFLEAKPLMVGIRAGTGELEDGVVYNRHDIPIVTPGTLQEYMLGGEPPMVFAAPGGLYVGIDPAALQAARIQQGLSLGTVAQIAGVSRRAVQMYEQGMRASIDAAMRLEEYLDVDLIRPVDPTESFDPTRYEPPEATDASDPLETLMVGLLEGLGYEVRATKRSPFHAISRQEEATYLTGLGTDSPQMHRRARIVHSVSRITERPGFFVIEHTARTEMHGVPVVSGDELRRIDDPERILELILERTKGRGGQE